jgi:phosphoglycerate kinase
MRTLDECDFTGKRVLVRVDFNVPLDGDLNVTDDTRIRAAVPTIQKIIEGGGSVVLMSHLGRPKDREDQFSLKHIVDSVSDLLERPVAYVPDCVGDEATAITSILKPGQVVLLENLRYYKEETQGDEFFAGQLAEHGDFYVNDAFGTAHREHASTAIIARFFPHDKSFGYIMEKEIRNINKLLDNPQKPVTAIIGGAKVSSKITIIRNLLDRVDHILIGGGMAYTFIAAQGGNVGGSLVEAQQYETALELLKEAKLKNVQIHLPVDSLNADEFSNEANRETSPINQIPEGWMGLDIGTETISDYIKVIQESATILWNGPMGVFEMDNFSEGTEKIALALADVTTENDCFTLVGGGDSVAAINKYQLAEKVSYVSTGGGAMLEYLEGNILPGISAISA